MELVEQLCDGVGVIAGGHVLAVGPTEQVRGGMPLQQRFLQLVGAKAGHEGGGLEWLRSSSVSN